MDLKIDPETGDLALDDTGDVATVTGADAIAQHIRVRLGFVRGEWFLNTREGVPYFEEIWVKGADLARVKRVLLDAIVKTPGVVACPVFALTDLGGRRWSLSFEAVADTGARLVFSDFVVGG
jgi:hypothetical protein